MSQSPSSKIDYSFEIDGLLKNIETLVDKANLGKYEAIERLEAIKKLANPIFEFSYSNYKQILNKKLPPSVNKAIQLYEMMSHLTYMVQPTGKMRGTACSVRLIDFQNLTWKNFLELRGNFSYGFMMKAFKQRASQSFNGLDMLDEEQKELYDKLRPYFGKMKKPTLQSLAMHLLNQEAGGKNFSESSLYNYLEAIKQYLKKRKTASGFDVIQYTFYAVTAFNDGETVREALEKMDKAIIQLSRAVAERNAALALDTARVRVKVDPRITENAASMVSSLRLKNLKHRSSKKNLPK